MYTFIINCEERWKLVGNLCLQKIKVKFLKNLLPAEIQKMTGKYWKEKHLEKFYYFAWFPMFSEFIITKMGLLYLFTSFLYICKLDHICFSLQNRWYNNCFIVFYIFEASQII